jgi:homoserine dehydrogenase
MQVADKPGVLATVAAEFSKRDVSISTVRQHGAGDGARLVVVTHLAADSALSDTVASLEQLDVVVHVASVLRLEGTTV